MAVASGHRIVSFGVFEVDLDAEEIRKAGLRVRLPRQPFRLLAVLLARPGEIVSREELQREIWGANTNVDFERGIATAVNRLREALGDSAEHPRYVETLARRGYRFIASVSTTQAAVPAEQGYPAYTHAEAAGPPVAASAPQRSGTVPEPLKDRAAPPGRTAIPHWLSLQALILSLLLSALALVALTVQLTLRFSRSPAASLPEIEQVTHTGDIYAGPPNTESLFSFATDGPRLYAPVFSRGRSELSSINWNSAQSQTMNLPGDLSSGAIADISRDGSRLLVRSLKTREPEQPLWVVPTSGSGAQRAGEITAHDATWMPGDESILFASGDSLGMMELATGKVSPYTDLPGRAFWLRWSPDGRVLRFTLLDPVKHSFALWELDPATRRAQPLSFPELGKLNVCCGSWTAAASGSQSFVFQAMNAYAANLWIAGAGSHPRVTQLTNGPIRFVSPQPSRNGRFVFAFGITELAGTELYDRALHRFTLAAPFLRDARRISFSRDGSWVAWTDSHGRLWRSRSDGTDALRLSGDDLEVFRASWSPQGRQLLLMARQPGETWQVFVVDATSGAIHRLLSDDRNVADPEWSADGSSIAYGREADLMGQESGTHDIRLFDLRTRQSRILPGSGNLFSPRWSPDGQWIAALSRDQSKLLLCRLQDHTWHVLYDGSAADPIWSADGRAIYFHAFAGPDAAIMRADVNGRVEKLVDLSEPGAFSADSYFFSGVTPEGSLLVKPRIGTGDLYRISLPE